jgi:hypothetical protein
MLQQLGRGTVGGAQAEASATPATCGESHHPWLWFATPSVGRWLGSQDLGSQDSADFSFGRASSARERRGPAHDALAVVRASDPESSASASVPEWVRRNHPLGSGGLSLIDIASTGHRPRRGHSRTGPFASPGHRIVGTHRDGPEVSRRAPGAADGSALNHGCISCRIQVQPSAPVARALRPACLERA